MANDAVVEKPVESSPAAQAPKETQPAGVPVESLNDAQRDKWLRTGEMPAQEAEKETPKDSKLTEEASSPSPTPEKAEVAEKEKPAESAPEGKAQEKAELPPSEARIKELLAKNKILEQQLADLRRPPERQEPAKTEEVEEAPKMEDFEDLASWTEAKINFEVKQSLAKDRELRASEETKARIDAHNKQVVQKWNESVASAKKKYPDFEEKAFAADFNIIDGSVLDRWCLESDMGTDVLYHYATHRDEFEALNRMTPVLAAREIAKTEVKLLEKPKPAPKVVSDAPKPVSEVSGRGTATDDPIAEALASGDIGKYMDLMNKKEREEFQSRR